MLSFFSGFGVIAVAVIVVYGLLVFVPLLITNIAPANRKGRSKAIAVIMSIIPVANIGMAIWLTRCTDRDESNKSTAADSGQTRSATNDTPAGSSRKNR